ncbi:AAA family ATPase [Mycobacteroides abscessus]|uniref:AAA family ATPase n=1 Tax=Mycobacteroides abscessus TaxID=36809 RepID=UPI00046AD529|nr:AAA family ATPase [Mycobacteroides abscessus]
MSQNTRNNTAVTASEANGGDPFSAPSDAAGPFSVPSGSHANGSERQEEPPPGTAASAYHWLMVADRLGAEPGDEIAGYLAPDQWEAVRRFARRHGVTIAAPNAAVERDGTRFEELDHAPLPAELAAVVCPDLEGTTRAEVLDFINDSVLHSMSDPEPALAKLIESAQARKRERAQAHQVLNRVEVEPGEVVTIAPDTEYALDEVERVAGAEVADAARRAIEQFNTDTWNMGPAARKHHRDEHTYLATAGELVNHGVAPKTVATMVAATPAQRSGAWSDLAEARALHRFGGVAEHDPVSRRWCSLDDLDALPSPGWLVGKLVPAAGLTRLVGMSQSLKSFIALDMALSVATGTPFAGLSRFDTAQRGHVIYVVGEGVHGIDRRVRAWCAQRGIDRAEVRKNLTVLRGAAQLGSRRDMAEVRAKVIETGACLTVFDTQARCTVELEENSATEQGKAIAALDALMRATDVAVLMLHHTTKSDPRNARGSVAWTGAVDTELVAVRDGDKLAVDLEVLKMKDDDNTGTYPLKAVKVTLSSGGESLVLGPGTDPITADFDPDRPIEQWTGKGAAYAKPMYELAQENCIPGDGLTQHRLSEIANEVVGTEMYRGKSRDKRRVCSKNTAVGAVQLLVQHKWLVVAKRDPLGHVFYEPKDYPPLDPAAVNGLTGEGNSGA